VGRKVTAFQMIGRTGDHGLTVTWSDEHAKEPAAIFELPGKSARTTLTVVETHSGRRCLYRDERARKYRAR